MIDKLQIQLPTTHDWGSAHDIAFRFYDRTEESIPAVTVPVFPRPDFTFFSLDDAVFLLNRYLPATDYIPAVAETYIQRPRERIPVHTKYHYSITNNSPRGFSSAKKESPRSKYSDANGIERNAYMGANGKTMTVKERFEAVQREGCAAVRIKGSLEHPSDLIFVLWASLTKGEDDELTKRIQTKVAKLHAIQAAVPEEQGLSMHWAEDQKETLSVGIVDKVDIGAVYNLRGDHEEWGLKGAKGLGVPVKYEFESTRQAVDTLKQDARNTKQNQDPRIGKTGCVVIKIGEEFILLYAKIDSQEGTYLATTMLILRLTRTRHEYLDYRKNILALQFYEDVTKAIAEEKPINRLYQSGDVRWDVVSPFDVTGLGNDRVECDGTIWRGPQDVLVPFIKARTDRLDFHSWREVSELLSDTYDRVMALGAVMSHVLCVVVLSNGHYYLIPGEVKASTVSNPRISQSQASTEYGMTPYGHHVMIKVALSGKATIKTH